MSGDAQRIEMKIGDAPSLLGDVVLNGHVEIQ